MKSNFYLFVLAIGLIAINSCKKTGLVERNEPVRPLSSSSDTDVYAAGYETVPQTFNSTAPVYWKNGIINHLPTSITGVANDITVQNGDVLIAGTEVYDSLTYATQAFYWRNGVKTVLAQNATATRIIVDSSGTNVYIAGSIGQVGSLSQMACYWKNGIVHQLHCNDSGMDNVEVANDIAIKGNDIWLAGMVQSISSGKQYPLYWKNDQIQVLSYTNTNAGASGIALNGSNVYISGSDGSGATIWKNGVASELPGGGFAVRLAFAGNDLYVAGSQGVYWKNNVMTELSNSTYTARSAQCITVLGNNVYIGGSMEAAAGPSPAIPAYWKNGMPIPLSLDPNSNGVVQGITAALHQ